MCLNHYNRTGRTVVGVKTFVSYKKVKRERVKQLKGCLGKDGEVYEQRYGDNWDDKLVKAISKEYCCVIELMDFMVIEAKRVYEGSEMQEIFLFFMMDSKHGGRKSQMVFKIANYTV